MASCYAVLLGNSCGEDGISGFSREILFSTAGELMADALSSDIIRGVFHIKDGEVSADIPGASVLESLPEQEYEQILSQPELLAADHLLLISACMPELERGDYKKLLEQHLATGSDITIFSCPWEEAGEVPVILYDADGQMAGVGMGTGERRALPVAVFKTSVLRRALEVGEPAGHVYDLVHTAIGQGAISDIYRGDKSVTEVCSQIDAYWAQTAMQAEVCFRHMSQGVVIVDMDHTYISPDAVIGKGTRILPGTIIERGCVIGEKAVLGPNTRLVQATIGDGTSVNSSQIYESSIGREATVGPFAYIRPGCQVGDHTRLGDFVELKKSKIGNGTKVSHLTYIGDAVVGERVNFGCGTVVVNYDGYHKYQTTIGDDAFIGCNTNLVSPVTVGDRAFTAAGATITRNVPDGALAVSRSRQENKEGWNDRRRQRMSRKKEESK